MKIISLQNISKDYGNDFGIFNVNLNVEKGEFIVMTGPSGAGKSTLLKMIYLGEEPDDGEVIVNRISSLKLNSRNIVRLRRSCGIVFQDFKLFYDRDVYANLEFVLRVTGCHTKMIKSLIVKVLMQVGLQNKMHEMPQNLSGGEQQRVTIARAIINDPLVILADEPFRNLDQETANDIFKLLLKINYSGTAVILTTHDTSMLKSHNFREIKMLDGRLISDCPAT